MTENENRSYKRVRQPPSVPFLWEEKPGMPKKDWKPFVVPSRPPPPPPPLPIPVKLVASVPFKWEEKPGTPLRSFAESEKQLSLPAPSSQESSTPIPPPPAAAKLIDFPSPPIMDFHSFDESNLSSHAVFGHENAFELDFETFNFETDDSFSSEAPSLLANCLVSSSAISTAVPVENPFVDSFRDHHLETPSSPSTESDRSSTSSYVTGTSSLVGASFLECLFPLLPPHSGLLEKVDKTEKTPMDLPLHGRESKHFNGESNNNFMVRKAPAPTLGELIMMSRRRSMQRKVIEMRKINPSMELIEEKPYGCCMFGKKVGLAEGLQKKIKWQPILRLV